MKITRKKLNNGIRTIHYRLPATESVTVCALFSTGSAQENEKQHGMAHFLEHLIFDGSKNHPDPVKTHIELERLGVVDNAWTYKNITNYWMKSPVETFPQTIDILFDRVFHPILAEESIHKQKGIVTEEIKMGLDNPWRVNWTNLSQKLFRNTPLAHPVIGTEESVNSFSQEHIQSFYTSRYNKDTLTVWIGGNIDAGQAQKNIEKQPIPQRVVKEFTTPEPAEQEFGTTFSEMDIDLYYISIGLNGISVSSKDLDYIHLANVILGEGLGSLLYDTLKIQKPLVSEVGSDLLTFRSDGMLMTAFITNAENLEESVKCALTQLKKLVNGDITEQMIHRAKNMITTQFQSLQESSDRFGQQEGYYNLIRRELLSNKEIEFDDVLAKIRNASKEDIVTALQNCLHKGSLVVSGTGPRKKSFNTINQLISHNSIF